MWLLGMRAFSVGDHVFGQAPQTHPRSPPALIRGSPPFDAPFDTQRCCCVRLPQVWPKWAAEYMISEFMKARNLANTSCWVHDVRMREMEMAYVDKQPNAHLWFSFDGAKFFRYEHNG
jgi:hypothetical protein